MIEAKINDILEIGFSFSRRILRPILARFVISRSYINTVFSTMTARRVATHSAR